MTVKVKIEIPDWAVWDLKPTILDKVHSLVEALPKGHMFYSEIIHQQVIKDKHFSTMKFRRTHEALQDLHKQGILEHDKKDRHYFASVSGNKVKLYRVV